MVLSIQKYYLFQYLTIFYACSCIPVDSTTCLADTSGQNRSYTYHLHGKRNIYLSPFKNLKLGEKANPNVIQNLMTEGFLRSAENLFDEKNEENGNPEVQKDYSGPLQDLRLKDKAVDMTPVFEQPPRRRKRSSEVQKRIPSGAWLKKKHYRKRSWPRRKRGLLQNRQLESLTSQLLRKNICGNAVLNNKAYGREGLAGLDAQKETSEFFTGVDMGRDVSKDISGMDPTKKRRMILDLSNNTRDVYKDLSGLTMSEDFCKTMEGSRNSILPGLELSSGSSKSTDSVDAEKEMIKALTGLSEKHPGHRQLTEDLKKENDKKQYEINTAEEMLRALASAELVKKANIESKSNFQTNKELIVPDVSNLINKAIINDNAAEGIIRALASGDAGKGLRRDLSNVYESMDKNKELVGFENLKTSLKGDNAAINMFKMLTGEGNVQDIRRDSLSLNGNNPINRELSTIDISKGFNRLLKGENPTDGMLNALMSSETGKGTRKDLNSFNSVQMGLDLRRHDPVKRTNNPFNGENTAEGMLNSLVSLENGKELRRNLASFGIDSPTNHELAGLGAKKGINKSFNFADKKIPIGNGAAKDIKIDITGNNAYFPVKNDLIQGLDPNKGLNKPYDAEGIIKALTSGRGWEGFGRDMTNANRDLFLNNRELSGIYAADRQTLQGNDMNDYVKLPSIDSVPVWDGAKREALAFNEKALLNESKNMEMAGVDIARGINSHLTGENSLDLAELSSRGGSNRDISEGKNKLSGGGNPFEIFNNQMSINNNLMTMGIKEDNLNTADFSNYEKEILRKTDGNTDHNFSRVSSQDFAGDLEAAQEMYKVLASQDKRGSKDTPMSKGVRREGKTGLEEEPAELGIKYRGKPCIKWLSRRCVSSASSPNQDRWDAVQRRKNRCRPRPVTEHYCSLNEGKTGRVCFPASHRCMRATCPCRVTKIGVPPRTTCCEVALPTICTTPGRCCGEDMKAFTPCETEEPAPAEDEEGASGTSREVAKTDRRGKRSAEESCCHCECGCTCSSGVRKHRPQQARDKAKCGCSCGCGCVHNRKA